MHPSLRCRLPSVAYPLPVHAGCPQLHMISAVSASPSQYVLQYLLSGFALHLQLGWAHFVGFSMFFPR